MAKNKAYDEGKKLAYNVGSLARSGDPVRIGSINGVAITDAGAVNEYGYPSNQNDSSSGNLTGYASVDSTGVWRVTSVITSTPKDPGTPIYAIANGTAAEKKVTLTDSASGNKLWGHLVKRALVGASVECYVRVVPSAE